MAKKKARRGIINLYVLSTHGMERKCNETEEERQREREREKEDRRTNFEKLTKKREREGAKNNEDRLKL